MRQIQGVSEISIGDHILLIDERKLQWIGIVGADGEHIACKMGWFDTWYDPPSGRYTLAQLFHVGATVHVLEDEDPYDFFLVRQAKVALGVRP